MRVIFVPVADRPECAAALTKAFDLGHELGASVIGCHIRPHRNSPVAKASTSGLTGLLISEEAKWERASTPNDAKKAQSAAKVLFSEYAERHGYDLSRNPRATPSAVWMEKIGSPDAVISIMGPMADLIVVSRPSTKGGTIAGLFLSAALLKSSRPVLVLPQTEKRTVGRRICIAWNQSVEASLAVAAAMPLLQQADHVSIVTCGGETQTGPKSSHLATYLKYWSVKSEHVATQGKDVTKEIIASYKSTGSDLLVMGAYSRNRMSRLVFGGMTEYVLNRASIPIFMLHT